MIYFHHTSKSYSDRTLRSDFHHTATSGSKIALIGSNGCGKSTMLTCITSQDTVDEGSIQSKGLITHITQEIADKYLNFSIEEYWYQYLSSHDDLYLGYIAMDERGIQFDTNTQLKSLSGGQRKIIQLMTLSFKQYDIILLDEPTNHLDIQMKNKLSTILQSSKAIIVCISHDRHFINQRSNQVRNIDNNQINTYPGNYDDYCILREETQSAQNHAHQSIAKELDRQTQVLAEFRRRSAISSSPKRGAMIRTRKKIIERMQSSQPKLIKEQKMISLAASSNIHHQKLLFNYHADKLQIAGRTLLTDISMTIYHGDKIALIGPNGCGKTTLIKQLIPYITEHYPSTAFSYIDQHNLTLQGSLSVLDRYSQQMKGSIPQHSLISQLLNAGFTHGQIQQSITQSSHGQKLKLKILTAIQSSVNLLILDEPTNHLDIPTIEALEHMIANYSGSVILISHDPYFITNCKINILYHIRNQTIQQEILTT